MQNINPNQFIDTQVSFSENSSGLVIEKYQEIPQEFTDSLRAQRDLSGQVREGETMRAASIPVIVVEKWLTEGFPFWSASAKEIVAKLQMENLDYFVTTNKQV